MAAECPAAEAPRQCALDAGDEEPDVKPCKPNARKSKVPALAVLSLITLLVFILDIVLQDLTSGLESSTSPPPEDASRDQGAPAVPPIQLDKAMGVSEAQHFLIEIFTVVLCMALPAIAVHFGLCCRGGKVATTWFSWFSSAPAKDVDGSNRHRHKQGEPPPGDASGCSRPAPAGARTPGRRAPQLPWQLPGPFVGSLPPGAAASAACLAAAVQLPQRTHTGPTSSLARWNQAINVAAKSGEKSRAERLLAEIELAGLKPDTISYNSVIHACAKQGDTESARRWLGKMRERGVNPNAISYNILMDACVKADDAEGAEEWLQRMVEDGVDPNEVSYATVIHARAKRGEDAQAERWLRRMIESNVEPNVVSYNSLIYACGRRGDAEGAERWVLEMEARGLPARVTTYTAVVDACAKSGDVQRAEKWMDRMIGSEIEPNVVSYSAMIDACAKAGDLARAESWHARMAENGVKPNAHSFSAVINACAKAGDLAAAVAHLATMEEAEVPADVVVYSGVLDACAKVGDAERAKQVFTQMQAHGIQPNVVSYASLARPYAHRGDWVEVERLMAEMRRHGLRMNEYLLYAVLLAYANAKPRQAERAEAAFREACMDGVAVNKHVLSVLWRAVGRQRGNDLAQELAAHRSRRPMGGSRRAG